MFTSTLFPAPTRVSSRRLAGATALVLGGLLAVSCAKDDNAAAPAAPAAVTFSAASLFPEGVQYDAKNSAFLVSSLSTGNIGRVKDDGTYTVLATGSTVGIVSAVGLNLDDSRNRVLVASSNSTARDRAKLVSLNRDNGTVNFNVDLGALRSASNHFANDVAVDGQGNAYVTDSFAPVIYKVDAQGVASVFLDNAQLAGATGAFGLNGIVFHADSGSGYLLVAKTDNGTLFKVPIGAPATFTAVATTGLNLVGADGMLLQDDNTLQVVAGSQNRVYRLTSTNNWTSATLAGTFATTGQGPTTITRRSGADSYVIYANLAGMSATPPPTTFTIGKVTF